MSMLLLVGTVMNTFEAPKGVNKTTGETYGGKPRVQVMAENELQNGETRLDLVNLTVDDQTIYDALKGTRVAIPVGAFVNNGAVAFYAVKGSKPQRMAASA